MSGCVVKKCGCHPTPDHAAKYQDKTYGEGNRLMTLDQKKTEAVCTVCGKTYKV